MEFNPHALQMSDEEYHGDKTRVSKSGLDLIFRSPAHYYDAHLSQRVIAKDEEEKVKESAAFRVGKAVHCAILEPNRYDSAYVVQAPGLRKPTALQINAKKQSEETVEQIAKWNEFLKETAGKIILPQKEMDQCLFMRDNAQKHPGLSYFLEAGGHTEQSYFFTDPVTGEECKIRPDLDHDDFILDIKTTNDARKEEFSRSVWSYRYDVSGAFYTDGKFFATGSRPELFVIAALEKARPFNISLFEVKAQTMDIGRRRYERDMQVYHECRVNNYWPGYCDELQEMELPVWALKTMN